MEDELVRCLVGDRRIGQTGRDQTGQQQTAECRRRPALQRPESLQQVGHDPADQGYEYQHQVVQFMVVQRLFQLQVDQGNQDNQPQYQVQQSVEPQQPSLFKLESVGQRISQQ
ncbi:hypothetical protein D3C84_718070 [compost metagenome]